jgi:hypothetical protein
VRRASGRLSEIRDTPLAVNLVEDGYQVRVSTENRERIMAMESTGAMERGPF